MTHSSSTTNEALYFEQQIRVCSPFLLPLVVGIFGAKALSSLGPREFNLIVPLAFNEDILVVDFLGGLFIYLYFF